MTEREAFQQRLDAVESRLAGLVATTPDPRALTEPDPGSGERWETGQVWAHLAEFVPYWIEQTRSIVAASGGEPVAFGRTKSDAGRLAAIERDRRQPVTVLWSGVHSDIELLRRFLVGLDAGAWNARGLHPTRGVMEVRRIIDEFLIGHLEEHADQLAALSSSGRR
jgi:hypothetical protein